MTDEDNKFEDYVDSLRFDDEPSQDHQDKLEQQLLKAYDHRHQHGRVEPVGLYLHKLAMAAGFLIVCGVLFWGIDKAFITKESSFIANHPDKEILQDIIRQEQVTGTEKKNLVASMSDIWDLISAEDEDALVSVLQADGIARAVRTWAAKYLGKFGSEGTLTTLENTIDNLGISDPNDPLKIAAGKIRKRLDLPEPEVKTPEGTNTPDEAPAFRSLDDGEPQVE